MLGTGKKLLKLVKATLNAALRKTDVTNSLSLGVTLTSKKERFVFIIFLSEFNACVFSVNIIQKIFLIS